MSANPGAVANRDGLKPQVKAWGTEVVIARAGVYALGDANMVPDADFSRIVDPDVFTEPAVIADAEPPRELHTEPWLDSAADTDMGPEQAKDVNTPLRAR